jgi:putative ABC transport system permease protein
MIKDFFLLSINSMKRRKLRSWLTLLGIFIGILAVVSLISLGQGLKDAVTGQFATLSADILTIQNAETGFGPPGSTAIKKLNEHDLEVIKTVSGVREIIPRLLRIVKIEYNDVLSFGYVASMPEDKQKLDFIYTELNVGIESGRLLGVNDKGKVLLGNEYSTSDQFDKKIQVGSKIMLQGKEFQVIGILKKSSSFTSNLAILMTEDDMRDILNIPQGEYDFIAVRAESTEKVEKLAEDIKRKLRKDRGEKIGEEDFTVQTPVQAVEAVTSILNVVNIVIIGIAAISLLIGGIGVANTMYTSIIERKKEIGTMKAVGAKNRDILTLFVIESGMFGLVGGIAGALSGLILSYGISAAANSYFGQTILKFTLSIPLLLLAIGFSFLIGIISGFIPSFQASKLKPVDALRG